MFLCGILMNILLLSFYSSFSLFLLSIFLKPKHMLFYGTITDGVYRWTRKNMQMIVKQNLNA